MTHLRLSAISPAGMAQALELGPIMATTSWLEMSCCATEAAWSALPPLSRMIRATFLGPSAKVTPPCSLRALKNNSAAFLLEAPTAGISPVSSMFMPILTASRLGSVQPVRKTAHVVRRRKTDALSIRCVYAPALPTTRELASIPERDTAAKGGSFPAGRAGSPDPPRAEKQC